MTPRRDSKMEVVWPASVVASLSEPGVAVAAVIAVNGITGARTHGRPSAENDRKTRRQPAVMGGAALLWQGHGSRVAPQTFLVVAPGRRATCAPPCCGVVQRGASRRWTAKRLQQGSS